MTDFFHAQQKRKFLIDTIHAIVLKSTDGSETKSDSIMNAKLKVCCSCYSARVFEVSNYFFPSIS